MRVECLHAYGQQWGSGAISIEEEEQPNKREKQNKGPVLSRWCLQ